MSIRYVWGRYNIAIINQLTRGESWGTEISGRGAYGYVASNYTYRGGKFYPSNLVSASGKNAYTYPYFFKDSNAEENGASSFYSSANRPSSNAYWERYDVTNEYSIQDPSVGALELFRFYMSDSQGQGSKINDISTSVSGQYPTNGISGSYWYVYQGSDNIDPSISYDNKQTLTKEVTISLTPSASIQYGGTITYDYQVNIDGTNWVDIGSTTATSMNYTISATATQFQARVRARDNMGFTSTTWVTGPLATVAPPYIRTRLRRKNASGTYDLIHLMTSADSVVQDDGSNVQDIINNIKQRLNLS